jgi:hypothetical protein
MVSLAATSLHRARFRHLAAGYFSGVVAVAIFSMASLPRTGLLGRLRLKTPTRSS